MKGEETRAVMLSSIVIGAMVFVGVALGGPTMGVGAVQTQQPTLTVDSTTVTDGETTTVSLTLSRVPEGLAGYELTVRLTDPAVADITSVSYPDSFALTDTSISADNASASASAVDLETNIQPGAMNVRLATIELMGIEPGTTEIVLDMVNIDDDQGNDINPTIVSGALIVASDTTPTPTETPMPPSEPPTDTPTPETPTETPPPPETTTPTETPTPTTQTATEIGSCTVIDEPGRYVLIQDITDSSKSPCIEIDAGPGDVVFDGNGHTIDGTGSGTGIAVSFTGNATITNVVVSDWSVGIFYVQSSGIVHDSVVRDSRSGISIEEFAAVEVSDNRITNNGVGLVFGFDAGGKATNNTVASNGVGIVVNGQPDTLRNNVVRDNRRDGIVLAGDVVAGVPQDIAVVNNTISDNGDAGIELDFAFDNVLIRNTITGNDIGIEFDRTSNSNLLYDNYLKNEENVAFTDAFGESVAGNEYETNNQWAVSQSPLEFASGSLDCEVTAHGCFG